jgi:hypothetical protein
MAIDTTTPRTRRAILAGGLAAALAGTLGRAQRASAHDPDDVRLGATNTSAGQTSITNTATNGSALAGNASGSGSGVYATSSSGAGVYGYSTSFTGVYGDTSTGTGVHGYSTSGAGVYGESGTSFAVYATSGSGTAVFATSTSGYSLEGVGYSGALPAVLGYSYGNNSGLQGYSGTNHPPASPAKTGAFCYADQDASAVGVRGTSPGGRGGVFKGGAAQLRLLASTATTHPASGSLGDLFLDKNKRLWFCKGGTTWKQLA